VLGLNCLVLGDDPNHVSPIKIDRNESVGTLKDAIKDKMRPKFDNVPAHSLVLWKVSIPADRNIHENLDKLRVDFVDGKSLLPTKELSEVFSEAPIKRYIHIIVKASSSRSTIKQADPEEKDDIITALRTSCVSPPDPICVT
jgi:hypothetical protein